MNLALSIFVCLFSVSAFSQMLPPEFAPAPTPVMPRLKAFEGVLVPLHVASSTRCYFLKATNIDGTAFETCVLENAYPFASQLGHLVERAPGKKTKTDRLVPVGF